MGSASIFSAMPVVAIEELRALPAGRALLALDLGERNIGVAISDVTRTVASPLATLKKAKFTTNADELAALCAANAVGGIVIGLPVNMDGTEGPKAQSARQFAANLAGRIEVPISLWDERLSTAAVTRTLVDADASRRRRAEVVDKLAAAYILQGALDFLARAA
jgi:putative pre-16S rRNA nuclease